MESIVHKARSSVISNLILLSLGVLIGVGVALSINERSASAFVLLANHQADVTSTEVTIEFDWGAGVGAGTAYRNAFEAAIDDWDAASTSKTITFSQDASSSDEMWSEWNTGVGWYGLAQSGPSTGHITTWNARLNQYTLQSSTANVRRSVANHELGHILGLNHPTTTAVMNLSRNRETIYIPQSDDISGINTKYTHNH